jgi:hypothetical protein
MASTPPTSPPAAEPQFELLRGEPPREVSVDGVVSVMIRRGVAKLDFYQFVGIDPASRREQRRIHHRISMPLASLEELALILRRMSDAARQPAAPAAGASSPESGAGQRPAGNDGLRLID